MSDHAVGPLAKAILLLKRDQRFRFLLVGAVNTLFGMSVYIGLALSSEFLNENYMINLLVSQIVAICFSFFTQRTFVFGASDHGIILEFIRFSSLYALSTVLNWLALPALVEAGGINHIVAQTGFTVLMTVASYFWHKHISFRPKIISDD